jgi:hypothetical protein
MQVLNFYVALLSVGSLMAVPAFAKQHRCVSIRQKQAYQRFLSIAVCRTASTPRQNPTASSARGD